ncbi:hypothetical protein LJ656_00495 [Paraburkholderia sp. MMS20-SJTR3]|uniref:Transmembrane protein n=1 Tax=Paraburkholderia sejongensis TaxID=2886946 RepID=A0ABS8JMC8_9BURK|nr:hypothetical protein [Paraburkholderia sp. MMS20-SJTR3]MCC8391052.1 hypothetical protein [Paraburkholderia sp. MMS20-SJTR3]
MSAIARARVPVEWFERRTRAAARAGSIGGALRVKKAPQKRGFSMCAMSADMASPPLVAALFPVMMNVHLVALVMMLIGLSRSDCTESGDGCGDGENDLLHYKTLKSMLWSKR